MASSDPEKEEAAAATASSPANQSSSSAAAAAENKKQILEAAAMSRENFLRRLEEDQEKQQQPLQQQEGGQQQESNKKASSVELKSPPEDIVKLAQEAGLVAPGESVQKAQTSGVEENEKKCLAAEGGKDEGKMNEEMKLKKAAAADKSHMPSESSSDDKHLVSTVQVMKGGTFRGRINVVSKDKTPYPSSSPTPTGDQLLIDYLSKYCESSSSPTSIAESDPSNWIQDVDPSSLAYLKSLAGIQDETTSCNDFNNSNNNNSLGVYNAQTSFNNNMGLGGPPVNRIDSAYSMYSAKSSSEMEDHCYNAFIVHTPAKNEPCKTYECIVPKGVITGQPFNLKAGGVAVRVVCPKDAKVGSKIRFHLPLRLFKEQQQQQQEGGKKKNSPPSPDQVESQHLDEWTQDEIEMMQQQGGVYPHPSSFGGVPNYESQGGMGMTPSGCGGGSGWSSMYNNNYQGFVAPPLPSTATMAESRTTEAGSSLGHDSAATSAAAGKPKEDEEPKTTTDGKSKGSGLSSKQSSMTTSEDVQNRMLSLIENQQFQMQEMQARLDALGGMMAGMEQDVRFVRSTNNHQTYSNNRYNQPYGQGYGGGVGGGGGAPVQGYKVFGGLFGGGARLSQHQPPPMGQQRYFGDANYQQPPPPVGYNNLPVIPTQPTQQQQPVFTGPFAQQAQPERQHQQEQQPRQQPAPASAMDAPNPLQQGAAANNTNIAQQQLVPAHERAVEIPMNQGIFFPLFVMLFQFLFSIPGQVRSLLLSTGPGRVYVHLRDEAIDRRAFANVDLSSIIKLLVMLLIFTGRVGRNENNGGRPRRNGVVNQEAENGMLAPLLAYAASLLQRVVDYWNGHRVHTLVLAAVVAFLIQVGLMSFLYEVLWVERGELWNVWLGRENEEEDEGENDLADDADGQGGNIGDAAQEGGNNPAAPGRRQIRVANGRPAQAANPHGGLIRRGPNNGGFFHDIQCLLLSFLLSLIPNWRPEEAAQEFQVTSEDDEQQQQQETIEGADQAGEQSGQQFDGEQDATGADEQPAQEGEGGNNEDAAD